MDLILFQGNSLDQFVRVKKGAHWLLLVNADLNRDDPNVDGYYYLTKIIFLSFNKIT